MSLIPVISIILKARQDADKYQENLFGPMHMLCHSIIVSLTLLLGLLANPHYSAPDYWKVAYG